MSLPVYQFLGYKLIEAEFHRNNDEIVDKFSFQVIKSEFNKENNNYNCLINVKLHFKECEESKFLFLAGFKINDEEWFNGLKEESKDSIFFSIVFPFIRQKINVFCDDSRQAFIIPIVDLKGIDVRKEVVYTLNM